MNEHQENNFDIFRLFLASIVVLVHVYAATQSSQYIVLNEYLSGDFAVKCFFVISGILVSRSYISTGNVISFYLKRFLRIYPAYIFIVLLSFFVGSFLSSLSFLQYIKSYDSWSYLFFNSIFLNFVSPSLPGVFADNKIAAINTSLWTIKVEVALYLFLPVFVWVMNILGNIRGAFLFVVASIVWVIYFKAYSASPSSDELARQFPGQVSFFILGVLFSLDFRFKNQIVRVLIFSTVLYFFSRHTYFRWIVEPFFFSSLVIYLCCIAPVPFKYGLSDISYGVYLFHFPLIQVFVLLGYFVDFPFLSVFALFLFVFVLAYFSWNFVERPFLRGGGVYSVILRMRGIGRFLPA